MCCFSGAVQLVANTRIFARFLEPGRQCLIYQMLYEARDPVAMILPLPIALPAHENDVRFFDLKGYATIFDDLAKGFPALRSLSLGAKAAEEAPASRALVVHDVGDFVASFVPRVDDFKRLDKRFVIPKSTWAKIPAYADYGFAVFQLKERGGEPHPMAFSFPTRLNDTLFFPTVHIHDGAVHDREAFDHALYLQGMGPHGEGSAGIAAKYVDSHRAQGLIDADREVRRLFLRGQLPNTDTLLTRRPESYTNALIGATGAAVIAAALWKRLKR